MHHRPVPLLQIFRTTVTVNTWRLANRSSGKTYSQPYCNWTQTHPSDYIWSDYIWWKLPTTQTWKSKLKASFKSHSHYHFKFATQTRQVTCVSRTGRLRKRWEWPCCVSWFHQFPSHMGSQWKLNIFLGFSKCPFEQLIQHTSALDALTSCTNQGAIQDSTTWGFAKQ